jgi:hypothetical protein
MHQEWRYRLQSAPKRMALLVMLLSSSSIACATARINDFKEFSKLGAAYADATSALMDEAAVTAIDADSALLASMHAKLDPDTRLDAILTQNELLKERVTLLRDVQRHAKVLRSYFGALGALAESDAATEIGKSAEGVATAAKALGEQLQGSSGADKAVKSFLQPAVTLIVTQFQRAALERELNARADIIDHELNIQQAAVAVVAETLREDQTLILQTRETKLARSFRGNKLPTGWEKERRHILLIQPNVKAAEQAVAAAKNLRLSFQGLVEGRFDISDLGTMLGDLNEYVSLVEKIESARSAG